MSQFFRFYSLLNRKESWLQTTINVFCWNCKILFV